MTTPDPKNDFLDESTVEVTVSRDLGGVLRISGDQRAFLVVIAGGRLGERMLLGDQPVTIGRGQTSNLVLDSDSVSRHHARIEPQGDRYRVVDLESTNGTYVNENLVSDRTLNDGDRIQIGKVLIKYVAHGNVEGAYHAEVQRLMHFDGLTALHNKAHFDEALRSALAPGRTSPVSLIVFDIDHFKKINDTRGHTAGDAVLRQLAAAVKQVIPDGHVFARVGGEEFAVIGYGMELGSMRELAELIRARVEATSFVFDGKSIPTTVSLGVSEWMRTPHDTPTSCYQRADERLYAAKRGGRNRVA